MVENLELVELFPLEFLRTGRKGKRTYPALVWYKDLKISSRLNQDVIDRIIREIEVKGEIHTIKNPDNVLYWQYHNPLKPLIIIDLRGEKPVVCTTKGTVEHFGLRACQQQASIVLRILKKYGYAFFKRIAVSTYRLGNNEDKLNKIVEAYKDLLRRKKNVEGDR